MATCKDCLHVDVCCSYLSTAYNKCKLATPDFKLLKNIECDECQYFKDRSRFMELPCKAGTTVYTVSLKHGVVPWGVYAICSTVNEWDAAPKITLLARSKKIDKSAKFSANAVRSSVIFTREEAEQALKEREENETDN